MAFDPVKALSDSAEAQSSVQMWTAGAETVEFASLEEAVRFAMESGGRWNDVQITVHFPREDIAYGTDKCRMLMDVLKKLPLA